VRRPRRVVARGGGQEAVRGSRGRRRRRIGRVVGGVCGFSTIAAVRWRGGGRVWLQGGGGAALGARRQPAKQHGMKRRAAVARRAAAWDAHPAPPNRLHPLLFLIQRASLPLDLIAYEKYPLTLADHCSLQVIAFLHPV
jgi:hypothetical protein